MRTHALRLHWASMAVVAGTIVAQTPSNPNGPTIRAGQTGSFAATGGFGITGAFIGGVSPTPVAGSPYSAEQVSEHVQTLIDGTRIAQTTQKVMLYRDSQGRTRIERSFTPPPGAVMVSAPSLIEITDPVAGYRYMLDQHAHVARRTAWQRVSQTTDTLRSGTTTSGAPSASQPPNIVLPNPVLAGSATTPTRPHPEIKHESLGTQIIGGITAEVTRMTMTFPEGSVGNDRPITTISETWTSPELKVVVLSKVSDPRNGESTTKVTNISQTEPAPSLFEVPAGYSVVDEQPPASGPLR